MFLLLRKNWFSRKDFRVNWGWVYCCIFDWILFLLIILTRFFIYNFRVYLDLFGKSWRRVYLCFRFWCKPEDIMESECGKLGYIFSKCLDHTFFAYIKKKCVWRRLIDRIIWIDIYTKYFLLNGMCSFFIMVAIFQ